ncbi:MAG: 4-hydroxy-tetrahydrodipicolinate reductase [Firmicutes bacterium]|nr:4-hydroxy-tetrahydrodipicolinate reductase [Bacillota bacterium]
MIKLFLVGIDGKMGRTICKRVSEIDGFEIAGGFDKIPDMDYKVFTDIKHIDAPFDAVIDFSRPETLDAVIKIADKFKKPTVIATTGYSDKDLARIRELSKKIPVFLSGNMSVGIHMMRRLVQEAAQKLWGEFDIEIIEKHHNQKIDAPSGTAKMLGQTVQDAVGGKAKFIYGREGADAKRQSDEVAVHTVRGGTIVGEHEVIFAGNDEVITVSHAALSRAIFADGAIKAAGFLLNKPAGLYEMKDMIG